MKSFLLSAVAATVMALSLFGAGSASASPAIPVPLAPGDGMVPGDSIDGADAMMMVQHMMWECMYGGNPGVPRAILQDRGVQFVCM